MAVDVAGLFKAYCGPSALLAGWRKEGKTLTLEYTIPALGEEKRKIVCHLRNGLDQVLRRQVIRCADSARNDAYIATGQRAADMAQLLKGKLVSGI